MFKSKLISTREELNRFIAFNQANQGAPVSMEYLTNAKVRVFFEKERPDRYLAGYAVNACPPFRYLSVMSTEESKMHLDAHQIRESDIVEITMIVKKRSYRWSWLERLVYYSRSVVDAKATGRPIIFGGTVSPKLKQWMMQVLPQIFFSGEANFFGMKKNMWLFYERQDRLLINLFSANMQQLKLFSMKIVTSIAAFWFLKGQ